MDTVKPAGGSTDFDELSRVELAEVQPRSHEGSGKKTEGPAGDVLDKTLREERPDAFDPGEFNARYHGAGRKRNALNGR